MRLHESTTMTTPQKPVQEMTADEIRVKCAEAMGWTPHAIRSCDSMWFHPGEKHRLLERTNRIPKFTRSLDAAITLCDHLAGKGWRCRLDNGLDKTWECIFYKGFRLKGEEWREQYGAADTLPLAICRCFLLVIATGESTP
jgi:hypothetical protein